MPVLSRRRFLLGLAASPVVLSSCSKTVGAVPDSRRALPIPPLAASTLDADGTRVFGLRAAPGRTAMVTGMNTPTWGYDGSILGPTLRARRGEAVAVEFENALPEPTTVHWHGMHLPARCDGGPHHTVAPGGRWRPAWTIRQPAATLWYHPHPHGATEKHLYRGLAGLFIVDDDASPAALPHDYGVDDVPLIIQDRRFTPTGTLDESDATDVGLLGDTIVTNGINDAYLSVPSEKVRLRILNGSGGRLLHLGFDDDREFHLVATDGGLVAEPVGVHRVLLSPGERAEIVVTVTLGVPVSLRAFPIEERTGIPAGKAHRFGFDDSFHVLEIRPHPTLSSSAALPTVLTNLPAAVAAHPHTARSFDLRWHMINSSRMDMDRVDFCSTVDTDEIWTVRNVDDWPHNFHVHDTQFRIVDVDGEPPPAALAGYKDTVYTPPGQRIRLAVRFSDYTDRTWAYMYHCHLALHEDQGMMGQFLVLAPGDEPAPAQMDMSDHAMR
ncbi:multicopper oxidase domain-containing protein [Mycobacterium yunnanensis]|uniref:Multicopper oxidase CueO n=1 Tax=Mycobacterium yunnanensis TaxID=368477 RepID=A0A9X2YPI0_9MYCO|nr:multicopper oxidase domain-containing protein [Mycobacterium yunnanensis]MCV7423073.1 multicopper oxidase domain-containing protein [Mycobacterium yunnanensis]